MKACHESIVQAFELGSKYVKTSDRIQEFSEVSSENKPMIKQCLKNAVSEIDFGNLAIAVDLLVKASFLFN